MIEVLERHAQHLSRQGLRQLSTVLRIQPKSVLCELCLCHLAGAAIFAIHRRLDDDTRRIFVRRLGNFEVHVAVSGIHTGLLHEGVRDVKDLEFTSSPRSVRRHEGVLCPTQNSVDSDFLGGDSRDGYVLGDVAKVGDVRLNREALAQIFGSRLQNSVIASVARADAKP